MLAVRRALARIKWPMLALALALGFAPVAHAFTYNLAAFYRALTQLTLVLNESLTISSTPDGLPRLSASRSVFPALLRPDGKIYLVGGRDSAYLPMASVDLFDPATGTTTALGNMNVARHSHTATLLPDGKIFICGGAIDSPGNPTGSTEIFDPVAGTSANKAGSQYSRKNHTAVGLGDGRVVVEGGAINNAGLHQVTVDVYDSTTNTWANNTGSINWAVPRVLVTKNVAPQMVYYTGGTNGSSANKTLYQWDPATNTLSSRAAMSIVRTNPAFVELLDGRLMVTGGYSYNTSATEKSCEVYNRSTNTWSACASMAYARNNHTMSLLSDGRVLAVGSGPAEVYDPSTNTWAAQAGIVLNSRTDHQAVAVGDGSAWVLGGGTAVIDHVIPGSAPDLSSLPVNSAAHISLPDGRTLWVGGTDPTGGTARADVSTFDPRTLTFTKHADLPVARNGMKASWLFNGKALLTGGNVAEGFLFDSGTNTLGALLNFANARMNNYVTYAFGDGSAIVFGGSVGGSFFSTTTDLFNPTTQLFENGPALFQARFNTLDLPMPGATSGSGYIGLLRLGGNNSMYAPDRTVEYYHAATRTWTTLGTANADMTTSSPVLALSPKLALAVGSDPSTQAHIAQLIDTTSGLTTVIDPPTAVKYPETWLSRKHHNSTSGSIVLFGGTRISDSTNISLVQVYRYTTGTWTSCGAQPDGWMEPSTIYELSNGELFTSSWRDTAYASQVGSRIFDPMTCSWTTVPDFQSPRTSPTYTQIASGDVAVYGGTTAGATVMSVERYNRATNAWVQTHTLSGAGTYATAHLLADGQLFLQGGSTAAAGTVYGYDVLNFYELGTLPTPVGGPFTYRLEWGAGFVFPDGKFRPTGPGASRVLEQQANHSAAQVNITTH